MVSMPKNLMATGGKAGAVATGIIAFIEVAQYLKETVSESDTYDTISKAKNAPKSVTEFNKKASIESRVYLDSLIANEPVIHSLLTSLQNLYTAHIMNALQLNEYVSDTHKVSDNLSIIATEDRADDPELYNNLLNDFSEFVGMESNLIGLEDNNGASSDKKGGNTDRVKIEDPPTPKTPLPEGRQISVTMTAQNKDSMKINLMIVLKPYYVKQELVKEMIKLDMNPDIMKRYYQWRVGEISFMRDFVFQIDQIKQRIRTVQSDDSKTLFDYIDTQTLKGRKRLMDYLKFFDSKKAMSSNVANTILVFSEDAVKRAKADTGFDLHKKEDRNSYFNRIYAMFICIIDPMYNKVSLYIHGYDNGATYSYSDFTTRSKDVGDIKTIIETLAQNRMPSGGRF